jgi:hypothetical protein
MCGLLREWSDASGALVSLDRLLLDFGTPEFLISCPGLGLGFSVDAGV